MSDLLTPEANGRQPHTRTTSGGAKIMKMTNKKAKKRTCPRGVLSWSWSAPTGRSCKRSKLPEISNQGKIMARLNLRLAAIMADGEQVLAEKRQ